MESFSIENCYPCKLAIGSLSIGLGLVLGYKSRSYHTVPSRLFLLNSAIAFSAFGTARIFNLWPFHKKERARKCKEI